MSDVQLSRNSMTERREQKILEVVGWVHSRQMQWCRYYWHFTESQNLCIFFQMCPSAKCRKCSNFSWAATCFPTWCATIICYEYGILAIGFARVQGESASWAFGVRVETPTRFRIDILKWAKLQESSHFDASKMLGLVSRVSTQQGMWHRLLI